MAYYAILVPITTLKLDQAIVISQTDDGAQDITHTAMQFCSLFNIILALLILVLIFGFNKPTWLLLLPMSLWLGGIYTLSQQWSARVGNFKIYANAMIWGGIINATAGLALGLWMGDVGIYLMLSYSLGMAVSFFTMYHRGFIKFTRRKDNEESLIDRIIRHKQFPTMVLPPALINSVGPSCIPLIITAQYTVHSVGQYALANRILLLPAAVIGGALTEAFRSEFALRLRQSQNVNALYMTTIRNSIFLALPIFLLIAIASPRIFSIIFGESYAEAGHMVMYLALGAFAQFMCALTMNIFTIFKYFKLGLLLQLGNMLLPLVALYICGSLISLGINATLFVYSCTSLAVMSVVLIAAYYLSLRHDEKHMP